LATELRAKTVRWW